MSTTRQRQYTPTQGAAAPSRQAPRLGMTDVHVELIAGGCKRSTLRTRTHRGWYTLHRDAEPVMAVLVEPVSVNLIEPDLSERRILGFTWPQLSESQQQSLAKDEGYQVPGGRVGDVQAFVAAIERSNWAHLKRWLAGQQKLILHRILRWQNV